MTHYIGTLYFLGRYRPLSVEGDTPEEIFERLEQRAQEAPPEARERLHALRMAYDPRYTSQSVEHGCYGACMVEADRPAFEGNPWESLPPCPGLIYN